MTKAWSSCWRVVAVAAAVAVVAAAAVVVVPVAAAAACNPTVITTAMQPFLQQVPTPSETRDRGKRLFFQ